MWCCSSSRKGKKPATETTKIIARPIPKKLEFCYRPVKEITITTPYNCPMSAQCWIVHDLHAHPKGISGRVQTEIEKVERISYDVPCAMAEATFSREEQSCTNYYKREIKERYYMHPCWQDVTKQCTNHICDAIPNSKMIMMKPNKYRNGQTGLCLVTNGKCIYHSTGLVSTREQIDELIVCANSGIYTAWPANKEINMYTMKRDDNLRPGQPGYTAIKIQVIYEDNTSNYFEFADN